VTSTHFSEAELRCKCGCGVNLCTQALVDALEAFRSAVGKPVIVTSAYRCPGHNAVIGGAKNSEHMKGQAADIKVAGLTPARLEAIAREIPGIRGIGRDDKGGFIHIDTRAKKAQWCYDANGQQCKYYPPSAHPTASTSS